MVETKILLVDTAMVVGLLVIEEREYALQTH
jgi:hypothetical protein